MSGIILTSSTLTPNEFNHKAIELVLISCVLPDKISLPIIIIPALTCIFFPLINILFIYEIYQEFNKRQINQKI